MCHFKYYAHISCSAMYLVHSLGHTAEGHIAGGWTHKAWYVLIVETAQCRWVEHYRREQTWGWYARYYTLYIIEESREHDMPARPGADSICHAQCPPTSSILLQLLVPIWVAHFSYIDHFGDKHIGLSTCTSYHWSTQFFLLCRF